MSRDKINALKAVYDVAEANRILANLRVKDAKEALKLAELTTRKAFEMWQDAIDKAFATGDES